MSVPLVTPAELAISRFRASAPLPMPLDAAVARARSIAESDPRVSVVVETRNVAVSTFISRPHSNSGGWTLGLRYMVSTRDSPELLASAVVDLFNGELLSVVTFDPLADAAALQRCR